MASISWIVSHRTLEYLKMWCWLILLGWERDCRASNYFRNLLAALNSTILEKPPVKIICKSGLRGKHCVAADWFDFCWFHTAADRRAAPRWFCAIAGSSCLLIVTSLEPGSSNMAFARSLEWAPCSLWNPRSSLWVGLPGALPGWSGVSWQSKTCSGAI